MSSQPGKQPISPQKKHKVQNYLCMCGEVLVQTDLGAGITPERVEATECPRCGALYLVGFQDIFIRGWAIVQAESDRPLYGDYISRLSLSAQPPEKWRWIFERKARVAKWGESCVEVGCESLPSGEADFERQRLGFLEEVVMEVNFEYGQYLRSQGRVDA